MKRNSFLDLLKGICIIFVITTHYAWPKAQREELLFFLWIGMAIPIFMIITGYVYTKSFNKSNITNVLQAYKPMNFIPRFLRFAIPFCMAYIVEILLKFFMEPKKFHMASMLLKAFRGGQGYGGYYIPVLFQFLFVFPLIYFIIKKKGFIGVLICGAINVGYELMTNFGWFEKSTYRILVFRFILVIAYGCYLAFYDDKKIKKGWAVVSFVIGLGYLISMMKGYQIDIFPYWKHVNMIASLYMIPIMAILIRKGKGSCFPLELLGKASFNIFLVQKIYYHYFTKNFIYIYIHNFYLRYVLNVIICCIIGVIFYYIETPITKKLIQVFRRRFGKKDSNN